MKLKIVTSPEKHEKGSPVEMSSEQSLHHKQMGSVGIKFHINPAHPSNICTEKTKGMEGNIYLAGDFCSELSN